MERLKPKQQGDLGEADAIAILTRLGGEVSAPLFSSPNYDLVVDFGGGLLRVQVKTSAAVPRPGVFGVNIATCGGNQSWNRVVRMFDRSRCDLLYTLVADGRRWLIPSAAVDGRKKITVGGAKYSEYEIREVRSGDSADFGTALEWAPLRGGVGVGEPSGSVKSVPSAEWVRFPPPPSSPSGADASLVSVGVRTGSVGRPRISPGHQLTIPIGPFRAADLEAGDRFEVTAEAPGRIRLERVHAADGGVPSGAAQPEFPR